MDGKTASGGWNWSMLAWDGASRVATWGTGAC